MRELTITRRAVASGVLMLVLILLVGGGNLWATYDVVHASQHKWCQTIDTLDNADQAALKAPPAQRPHGAYSFALISDFHHLRGQLGCG